MSHFHLCKFATAVFQLCSVFPLCLFAFERTEDRRREGEVFDQTNTLPLWFFEPGLVCWGLLYEKQRFAKEAGRITRALTFCLAPPNEGFISWSALPCRGREPISSPLCLPATQAQVTQRTSGCRRGKDRQWMMEGLTWVEMTGREAESETASVKPIIWNKSDEFSSFKNDWTCREKESKLKPEIVFKTENIEDTMKITAQRELLLHWPDIVCFSRTIACGEAVRCAFTAGSPWGNNCTELQRLWFRFEAVPNSHCLCP